MHTSESRRAVAAFSVLLKLIFGRGGGGGRGLGVLHPPGPLYLLSAWYLRPQEHRLRFPDYRNTSIPMPVCKHRLASVPVFLCLVCEIYVCVPNVIFVSCKELSLFLLFGTKPCIKSKK